MPGNIRETSNRIPSILAVVDELRNTRLEVGIFAPEGSEEYIIAMVNEYGANITVTDKMRGYLAGKGLHLKRTTTTIKIPERSFIRAGYEANKEGIERMVTGLLPNVIHGRMTPENFYGMIGEYIVGKLHEYVQAFSSPPNHPFTVQQKGSDHPLIDTGRLNQSITYRVVRG